MNRTTSRLTIRLLGVPEAQVAGSPLTLNNQKARALLYYLAATGQPHTRDHLATLLWSESADRDARHSLRSDLYRLRQALRACDADAALNSDGDLIALQPAEYDCDILRFRQLATENAEDSWREAVVLYRGSLLEGFTLGDAPLFDEWVRFEEATLNRIYLQTLARLATQAESRQAWLDAIDYVQRIVHLDPLSEEAQQRLISLYVRQQAIGSALRQYQQFEATLIQEVGVAPTPETRALIDEALRRQHSVATDMDTSLQLSARPAPILPFAGRDQLLVRLQTIGHATSSGRGATVLLQGEAGIGKTRLVSELADRLAQESPRWLILRGSCSPFDDLLSYGPFLEAFQNAAAGDLTGLLTEPRASAPDTRGRFFYQLLQALRALTQTGPLLLAIDDLQWANSSTLNLFGFLVTRLQHLPVVLVGTVQNADAIPAVQRLITLSRRHGELQLLTLTSLSLEAVKALLQAAGLSATSIDTLAAWLHDRAGGSPFVMGEILSQLRADGILMLMRDQWRLDAGRWLRWRATFTLPETAHDLVAWRLANLTPIAQRVLEVLAVDGQPMSFAVLRDLPDLHDDQLMMTLDELISRRLILEHDRDTYALPHHVLRETLLHRLSHIRRRMIHRQLAEALESHFSIRDEAAVRSIALHAVAGEDIDRARRYGLQVLIDLPQDYSATESVGFFQHLYDLLAPTASRVELLRLTQALGQLHYSLGHIEVATHWQQQQLELAREANDLAAQATAYFEMSELALVTGDHLSAVAHAEAGLKMCTLADASEPAADQTGHGHRLLGAALAMEGSDLLRAEDHLRQALTVQRQMNHLSDLCATLFELGNVAAQRGDLIRALDSYAEAARTAEAGRGYYYLALAHNNLAYHQLLLGQLDAAQHSAQQGLKLAESYDMLGVLLYLYSTQGEIQLYHAEWTAATELFQRGLALAEELNHLERQAGYRAGLALAARGQHDIDRALDLLEEALTLISGQGYWHLRARLQIWLAEILLQCERVSEVWPHLESALTIAREHGRVLLLIQAERAHAQLLAATDNWPNAAALFAEVCRQTEDLHLALEVARTQAAWGEALLRYSSTPDRGYVLLGEARAVFTAHDARADLEVLSHSFTA
ncbi:MAG TPA: AAA family ATPase [Anaerolineae bacterium]|nr:AAA family ATPase [Anaerolineae bacterium]